MLAAVMPFPREEVTPPVTKTYFATGQVLRGFSNAIGSARRGQPGVLVRYVRYTSMPTEARYSAGVRWPSDWWGRIVLYTVSQARSSAWKAASSGSAVVTS